MSLTYWNTGEKEAFTSVEADEIISNLEPGEDITFSLPLSDYHEVEIDGWNSGGKIAAKATLYWYLGNLSNNGFVASASIEMNDEAMLPGVRTIEKVLHLKDTTTWKIVNHGQII